MDTRILLVGDFPPPLGGVSVHVSQLRTYLQGRGVPTKVLDIGKGRRPAPEVYPVHTFGGLVTSLARHGADGWLTHLHTSGNNLKAWGVVATLGAVPTRRPKVLTLHSGLLPSFLAASPWHRLLARSALRPFAKVIAVSEGIRQALLSSGVPAEKVVVLPAFLASASRAGAPPEGLAEVRARRSPLLSFAHHPSPVYGRGLMFEALRLLGERFRDVGLLAFGPGTKDAAFREDARRFEVAGRIDELGELAHPQALSVIAASDAFVRPTTADGDSISVREALALRTPCVASDVASRPAGTLLFRAGDVSGLVEAVVEAVRGGAPRSVAPDAGPVLMTIYGELRPVRVGAEVLEGRA